MGAFVAVLAGALYALGVLRMRARGDRWPLARSVAALAGLLLVGAAFTPPLDDPPTFPLHVLQHLMLAMAGPLALALAAPTTLALRTLPAAPRRLLLAVLHSRVARVLTWAPLVVASATGGTALYYVVQFPLTEALPVLHAAVHLHMLATGFLVAVVLVGPDPVPRRPGTGTALLLLLASGAAHDALARWMVQSGTLVVEGGPAALKSGASLLYTGGGLVDMAFAAALLAGWYARTGRLAARDRRRRTAATGVRPGAGGELAEGSPDPHPRARSLGA